MKRTTLKRGASLKRSRMAKGRGHPIPFKVRALVLARSKGMCEVGASLGRRAKAGTECAVPPQAWSNPAVARDMHHLVKRPRLHEPYAIAHLCRRHHQMVDAPYSKGRLVMWLELAGGWTYGLLGGPVDCDIRYLPASAVKAIAWQIEVRERKGAPLLEVRASGTIAL